jgi:hypothetical protein
MHDQDIEPLNALVQAQLARSAKTRLQVAAQQRHLKPATLTRVIIMEWLDANEPVAPVGAPWQTQVMSSGEVTHHD